MVTPNGTGGVGLDGHKLTRSCDGELVCEPVGSGLLLAHLLSASAVQPQDPSLCPEGRCLHPRAALKEDVSILGLTRRKMSPS